LDGAPGLDGDPGASPFQLVGLDAVYTQGNVGIGTTSPTAKLHVAGTVAADAIRFPDGTQQTSAASDGPGLWTANVPHIYNNNTGNVGIGTTSPAEKLSVAGVVESIVGGFKFPDGTMQTSAATDGPGFWTASGTHIYSNNTGNVGIGTTSPAEKLSVDGTVESTSGGFKFPDGTVQATAATDGNGGRGITSISQGTGIVCTPNPVTTTGTVAVDMAWADGAYVNEGQSDAIATAMIQEGAVTNDKLTNVDWSKITGAPTSFPPSGSAGGDLTGSNYPNPAIADGAVTSAKIADGTIATSDLANDAVTSDKIGCPGSITGKVLVSAGPDIVQWGYPRGLDLPFSVTAGASGSLLKITDNYTGGDGQTLEIVKETQGIGVLTRVTGNGYGIYAYTPNPGYAGYFEGNVHVTGNLTVNGSKNFRIDHPLDPANKYLVHSCVESDDMMNIYNGNAVTDERGYATITLPEWFEALNRDFRYQLTAIDASDSDAFVQAKVVQKIENNRFTIRTSAPNVEVSWQVTGIRQDPFANANRIPVEVDKPANERGLYLHPRAWGLPDDKGIGSEHDKRASTGRGPE
jgi:hypothetical protein